MAMRQSSPDDIGTPDTRLNIRAVRPQNYAYIFLLEHHMDLMRTITTIALAAISALLIGSLHHEANAQFSVGDIVGGAKDGAADLGNAGARLESSTNVELGRASETLKNTGSRVESSVTTERDRFVDTLETDLQESLNGKLFRGRIQGDDGLISLPLRLRGALTKESKTAWSYLWNNRLQTAVTSGEVESHRAIESMKKSPLYKLGVDIVLSYWMEPADPYLVNPLNSNAPPVYFVNGVLNRLIDAKDSADKLSRHLNCPVLLIYNPTSLEGSTGTPECETDADECVYDRGWPAYAYSGQHNITTRQLCHILYNSDSPIRIVSHSQGCLITRNAILACGFLGKEEKMRSSVTWVACAPPLNDWEIWPGPKNYNEIVNRNDPVVNVLGMRGGGREVLLFNSSAWKEHLFDRYYPQITANMIDTDRTNLYRPKEIEFDGTIIRIVNKCSRSYVFTLGAKFSQIPNGISPVNERVTEPGSSYSWSVEPSRGSVISAQAGGLQVYRIGVTGTPVVDEISPRRVRWGEYANGVGLICSTTTQDTQVIVNVNGNNVLKTRRKTVITATLTDPK